MAAALSGLRSMSADADCHLVRIEAARASRVASHLFFASGALTILNVYLPSDLPVNRPVLMTTALAALLLGLVTRYAPWTRLPAPLVLLVAPAAFADLAVADAYGGVSPYSYAVYYVVIFVWVGMTLPPRTSYALAPLAALAYVAPPLLGSAAGPNSVQSVTVVIPVAVLVGEVLARATRGQEQARTALHRQVARNEELASRDALTGLLNRRGFREAARRRLEESCEPDGAFVLLFLDLDGLKTVNDTSGHSQGDRLLQGLARVLQRVFRDEDVVGRLGGDEFAVLVPGVADPARVTARIADAVATYNATAQPGPRLEVSIGAVSGDGTAGEGLDAVLARADRLMYADKQRRRVDGPASRVAG